MTLERETKIALDVLRTSKRYVADAREGAPIGNSLAGSILNIVNGIPRQYAEQAVLQALQQLDQERGAE